MSLIRYWHTLRHLRPVQFYGRLFFRLASPRPNHSPAPDLREQNGQWIAPIQGPAAFVSSDKVRFLNKVGQIEKPADWNTDRKEKLWLYNLHYFDDLNAQGHQNRTIWHGELINRWIAENPAPIGNGWEPYTLSLRIVNWIKWGLGQGQLDEASVQSLAVQVRFLCRRLEYHLLGNHLFANGKALVFAGLFFSGPEAQTWLKKGLAILRRELPEQVLSDGGHFELSPMYHAIILTDLLDLINMSKAYPNAVSQADNAMWHEVSGKMYQWLEVMSHPDGDISFFNDGAFQIAPKLDAIKRYKDALTEKAGSTEDVSYNARSLIHLKESGYARINSANVTVLLDVAKIGPDYLPGHAHADTLSFELSYLDQRVLVNSGTSEYGLSAERLRQRSTSAHNTVEINSENSSEVWSGFRVARRAYPLELHMKEDENSITVACAHTGYKRLDTAVTHKRSWTVSDRDLSVRDQIDGKFETAISRFHIHPDVKMSCQDQQGELTLPNGKTIYWHSVGGHAKISPTTWHPEFGVSQRTTCLEITFSGPECITVFSW